LAEYNGAINRGITGVRLKGEGWDFALDSDHAYEADEIWDRVCRAASAEITDGEETDGMDWYREHGFRTKPFPELNWYLYPAMIEKGLRFEMPYQERLLRVGKELANRLHEHGIEWWDEQLAEYQALPAWKDFPHLWEEDSVLSGGSAEDRPFWLLTARSMQYAWGSNAGLPLMHEVASNIGGHEGIIINTGRAEALGIEEGDMIEITSALRSTKGKAVLRQGIRPDTLLMIGQFDHWKTPYAKDFHVPSMNTVTPMSMKLTDATGSSADLVRVSLRRVGDSP